MFWAWDAAHRKAEVLKLQLEFEPSTCEVRLKQDVYDLHPVVKSRGAAFVPMQYNF